MKNGIWIQWPIKEWRTVTFNNIICNISLVEENLDPNRLWMKSKENQKWAVAMESISIVFKHTQEL